MNDEMQDFDPMPYEQRMARKFHNNGGGLLTGAAGTGKTTLSDKVVELIQENAPGTRIVRAALTHVAALLQSRPSISVRMKVICECSFQFYMARGSMPCPKSFAAASYFSWV